MHTNCGRGYKNQIRKCVGMKKKVNIYIYIHTFLKLNFFNSYVRAQKDLTRVAHASIYTGHTHTHKIIIKLC